MPRQRILWFAFGTLILSSLACNAFTGAPEPALTLPPPPVTEADTPSVPDEAANLAPTATLPGEVTEVPLVDAEGNPLLEARVDVNVRTGPGVQYDRDGFLFAGETARVLGRDPVSGWWRIDCPGRSTGRECWVSGGAQYTNVTNGAGVPVAAVPPTPTPAPKPTPEELPDAGFGSAANGLLVYTDSAGLWLLTLDLNQDPPEVLGEPVQLVENPRVERPFIAPDGRKIAYMTSTAESNTLHVIDLDTGENHILVNSTVDLPVIVETDTAVLISKAAWLADSQGLAFNIYFVNLIGPGANERTDLWTVSLDGAVTERFDAGQGGGVFALSRNNQLIFGQQNRMVRADLNGNDVEALIPFDFINTASEYIFYPQAQWTADGRQAYVAIPNAEPWGPEAGAVLWRIPASGPAVELETLPGNTLFNPVIWTSDGRRLAYVMQEIDPANPPPVLMLADGNGRNAIPYTSDEQLTLYEWSADGRHFLYAGGDYYAIGQVDVPPMKIEVEGGTAVMRWLTDSSFIAATGTDGNWQLHSSDLDGNAELLVTINHDFVQIDAWAP